MKIKGSEERSAQLKLQPATASDVAALAALHASVADHLTKQHGHGPWSFKTSEKGVLLALRTSQVFVACTEGEIISTLRGRACYRGAPLIYYELLI